CTHVTKVLYVLFVLLSMSHIPIPYTLTLVAEPGHDVTIWCQHNLMEVAYIYWFTHTNHSVPHHVACQLYKKSSASSPCSFVHQSKRMVMSVNSQNTSLTITAVNHTDSGLYYCGIRQSLEISFSNTTYLQVTGNVPCKRVTLH
uniref:Ig-like domain-containing protein n=1 Tax=Electrophorus electricus TaxID=8005 RepID=A0AAY5EJ22_ELEEL